MMANSTTPSDPAGQRANRQRTTSAFNARLNSARRRVVELFQAIPRRLRGNAAYVYRVPPSDVEELAARIVAIMDEELGTAPRRVAPDWWMLDRLELPYRQGTIAELAAYNQLVRLAQRLNIPTATGMPPLPVSSQTALTSQAYRQELQGVYVRTYQVVKGMSNDTTLQVLQVIQSGTQAGDAPGRITQAIGERFNVAKSRAKRIVDTEVQWAYNKARLDAVALGEIQTGLPSAVIHISALIATTRPSHAARNGKVYSPEDQRAWWLSGTNLINCKCTTRPVLLDANGDPVR